MTVLTSLRGMRVRKRFVLPFFVSCLLLFMPVEAPGQLVLGQYEDEAPVRTWNTFGVGLAPALGWGNIQIAASRDVSGSLVNPALLTGLPRLSATVGGSYTSSTLFRYSILNTGVLQTSGNLADSGAAFDFVGVAFRTGRWAFAVSSALLESYHRPSLDVRSAPDGEEVYALRMSQDGVLRGINLSAARRLSRRLAAGIGVTLYSGKLERTTFEDFTSDGITIDDRKSRAFSGFYLNAGLTCSLSDRVSAAIAFRTPSSQRSESRSLLEYRAPAAGTDIRIESSTVDATRRPWTLGAGVAWRLSENWRVASDACLFGWSSYSVKAFGETKDRNFKNVLRLAAGLEHESAFRLFGRGVRSPVRLGICLDPQPMRTPNSIYAYLTFGAGLEIGRLRIDIGAAIGKESGSGNGLSARQAALSLTYVLGGTKEEEEP
jgi:hypothetical protein